MWPNNKNPSSKPLADIPLSTTSQALTDTHPLVFVEAVRRQEGFLGRAAPLVLPPFVSNQYTVDPLLLLQQRDQQQLALNERLTNLILLRQQEAAFLGGAATTPLPPHHQSGMASLAAVPNLDMSSSNRNGPPFMPGPGTLLKTAKQQKDTPKESSEQQHEPAVNPLHLKKQTFPEKVYQMLTELEADHQGSSSSAISFVANGTAFQIHDARIFETEIMPLYFSSTRMSSFQRQLNIYGFDRIERGPYRGAYRHECFRRGKPELLPKIQRTKTRNKKASSSAENHQKSLSANQQRANLGHSKKTRLLNRAEEGSITME